MSIKNNLDKYGVEPNSSILVYYQVMVRIRIFKVLNTRQFLGIFNRSIEHIADLKNQQMFPYGKSNQIVGDYL